MVAEHIPTNVIDPWREYRKRRNWSLFAFVAWVPFVLVVTVTVGSMACVMIAGNWFVRFRCPRCGNPFFADSKWWGYNTFTRHCLHCKLPLNAQVITPDWEHTRTDPSLRS